MIPDNNPISGKKIYDISHLCKKIRPSSGAAETAQTLALGGFVGHVGRCVFGLYLVAFSEILPKRTRQVSALNFVCLAALLVCVLESEISLAWRFRIASRKLPFREDLAIFAFVAFGADEIN